MLGASVTHPAKGEILVEIEVPFIRSTNVTHARVNREDACGVSLVDFLHVVAFGSRRLVDRDESR